MAIWFVIRWLQFVHPIFLTVSLSLHLRFSHFTTQFYSMFGWGNRYAFPPILRAHHQTGVWLAVMLLQPNSVPPLLTPLAVIAIPPLAPIRDSIPVSYFLFHFLPSSTSSSQTFPLHIASVLLQLEFFGLFDCFLYPQLSVLYSLNHLMARLPLIGQSVRRKRIGIALTIWLQICGIASWFLLTMGAIHSLHTYRPRIRSYILDSYAKRDYVKRLINVNRATGKDPQTELQPDRNQGGSTSSKKRKKNSDASDHFSSSFHDAVTLLVENMRAISEQISRSIASNVVVQQKSEEFQIIQEKVTNLYPTLCEIEGLTVDERYRALSKIPNHPIQILVFFSLPSDVQLKWVRRFLVDH